MKSTFKEMIAEMGLGWRIFFGILLLIEIGLVILAVGMHIDIALPPGEMDGFAPLMVFIFYCYPLVMGVLIFILGTIYYRLDRNRPDLLNAYAWTLGFPPGLALLYITVSKLAAYYR